MLGLESNNKNGLSDQCSAEQSVNSSNVMGQNDDTFSEKRETGQENSYENIALNMGVSELNKVNSIVDVRKDVSSLQQAELLSRPYPTESHPVLINKDSTTNARNGHAIDMGLSLSSGPQSIVTTDLLQQSSHGTLLNSISAFSQQLQESNRSETSEAGFLTKSLSPSDLIDWLFQDDNCSDKGPLSLDNTGAFSNRNYIDFHNSHSPVSLLDQILSVSPNFPNSNRRTTIDETVRKNMIKIIPSLGLNDDFSLLGIEKCLETYWLVFHPQYPILHRPSFSNFEAHPLLLLAMIMLGASLSSCIKDDGNVMHANPEALAMEIAESLRWLIFAHPDCKPPAKVWVIQSLLLLETYEITNSSRALHERAYLHHGTKIQILRRSPILGGDPLKEDAEDGSYALQSQVWKKWIEAESMKRATLMAFYLDTVHATVYGHMVILYAHQIKLSLPCDDSLWEFENMDQKFEVVSPTRTPKFLVALKKVLNRQKVHTNTFGKRILLAGLLTIMFQMQQKDLQLSSLNWNSIKDSWRDTISLAIDVWKIDVSEGGCCSNEMSVYSALYDQNNLPPMLRANDKRCKFCLYHISQIYLRITHYDYIIYAGAPSRMNVVASSSEYEAVSKRIVDWSNSESGRIAVIHSYLFLCEMFLSPENEDLTYTYDPNCDPHLHRKNVVASAILVIFAYNFSLEGPECDIFDKYDISGYYPAKENGYDYLRRIRRELSRGPGGQFHALGANNSAIYHNSIKLHAETLRNIESKNHIVGLLKIAYKSYKSCKWEVGFEYSNLFKNCIERCLGRKKTTCEDMYASKD
ncbi:uncharacterized protein PRCAT00003519001 [Priceomyces carsonii]|uniref:uncharacterized protein n=1 Tax=Priceomyces carsonii TaxID=28549 RepID=UPI002EDA6A5A|nr:unnamed protein product [Priceomyces carsonii]